MWSASIVDMLRTTLSSSITSAVFGRCSEICRSPAVLMGRNSPPVLAPGLRSHMSMVGAPPPSQTRITALPLRRTSAAFASTCRRNCRAGTVAAPAAMCRMKCRREVWSVANMVLVCQGERGASAP